MDNLTEDKWDRFCNECIAEKLQNSSTDHIHTGSTLFMEKYAVKISLEDLPEANWDRDNLPNYRTKSESTITTNSHQHSVNKTFSSTGAIGKTTTY